MAAARYAKKHIEGRNAYYVGQDGLKEALEENGLPTTNLNNLVRQAALESNYGLDPRGERGLT